MSILKSIKGVGGARGKRLSAIATVAGATAALLIAASAGTGAGFTSNAVPVTGGAVTGATFNLTVPTPQALNVSDMVPGDSKTLSVVVNNGGSVPLRYSMVAALDGTTLAKDLTVEVKQGAALLSPAPATNVPGYYMTATPKAVFGTAGDGVVQAAGTPAPGDREIAAAGTETLTVIVTYKASAGNVAGLNASSLLISLNAEQVAGGVR